MVEDIIGVAWYLYTEGYSYTFTSVTNYPHMYSGQPTHFVHSWSSEVIYLQISRIMKGDELVIDSSLLDIITTPFINFTKAGRFVGNRILQLPVYNCSAKYLRIKLSQECKKHFVLQPC